MNEINGQMSPELESFIRTLPKDKRASNVYDILVEDKDGNIVDHKFGVNVMVDGHTSSNGFLHEWVNNSFYNQAYVIIGTGTGIPQYTDNDLFNRLPTTPFCLTETIYGDGNGTQSCIFDHETGNIIGRRRTGQFVIDYNYPGIDANVNITEFAEGASHQQDPTQIVGIDAVGNTDWNHFHMNTHCLVYDEHHDPSYFIKRIDQKVTVTIYRANYINASVLNDLWSRGLYMFMWPPHLIRANNSNDASRPRYSYIMCGRCRSEDDFPLYESSSQKYDDWGNGRADLNTYANAGYGRNSYCYPSSCELGLAFNTKKNDQFWYRNNGTHAEFLMNNKYQAYGLRVVDCWGLDTWQARTYKMRDIWYLFEKINLDEPEEMVFNYAYTDSCFHTRFNNCFGLAHVLRADNYAAIWDKVSLPVNDFHITACKRYNYLTDDYDINEQFVDDPDYDFRNPERGLWGFYSDRSPDHPVDIPYNYNVYLNITDVPIIGFRESNTQRIWMTDAYWDTTTFVEVLDFNNVPAALQHKKYIIKTPDQVPAWNNNESQAYGIHPIREPNNHALVPSTPIVHVDLPETIQLKDYGNRNGNQNEQMYFKMIYASDDGWIVCENRLIYPESDDGTGHPYMYTLCPTLMGGPSSYDYRYIRYTDHHIILPDNRRYMKPTDTTNPRFIVITPDPTHPEIDPNTLAVNYYDADIMPIFGETAQVDAYWDGYVVMFTDPHNDRFFFARGNWAFDEGENTETHLVSVDLSSATPSLHAMANTTRFYTPICDLVYGTDNFVWLARQEGSTLTYNVYDLVNEQIIQECEIEIPTSTFTIYGVTGFKDRIYAMTYEDNESYYVHKYDYVNEIETEISNYGWGYLYYYSIGNYPMRNMQSECMDYDDETLVIHTNHLQSDGNSRYVGYNFRNSFAIFDDDLDHPCFFNVSIENMLFRRSIQIPRVKKMNGGKDYVVLLCGIVTRENYNLSQYTGASYTMPWVINLGYIKNKGYRNPSQIVPNTPMHYYRTPTFCYTQEGSLGSSNTDWYVKEGKRWWGQFTLYKNYFVSVTNLDQYNCMLSPIELLLPHQLTGTTRTINTYNNPKKFSSHSLGLYITNHLS